MTRKLIALGVLSLALALVFVPLLPIIAAHADAVDDWYAAVCGDNGLVFKRIAYLGIAVITASGLANFKSLMAIPVVGPLINFVALNWRDLLSVATKAADQSRKAVTLLAVIGASIALQACAQLGLTGNPAVDVPRVIQTIQPVESALACEAQRVANQTTTVGLAIGNAEIAAGGQLSSIVAGTFCNGLAAGAPLPSPIIVSGSTTVPTATGTLTLPVPAAPSAAAAKS